jgi:hypothetical protein
MIWLILIKLHKSKKKNDCTKFFKRNNQNVGKKFQNEAFWCDFELKATLNPSSVPNA